VTIIRPRRGLARLELGTLWRYRELMYFLLWRDIKVRYRQTILGAVWAVIVPFVTMVVFTLIFDRLARIPSDGLPYPIFAFAALVPWTFFATGIGQAANSLVGSQNLIKKVYFPRLVIPTSAVLTGVVDLTIAGAVLLGMMLFFGIVPTASVVWLLPLLLLAFITSLGVGLWLSALNVRYRDVRHIVPFLLQIWLFATPVAYPSSLIAEPWRTLYALNPMVGVVEGFRWALLGAGSAPGLLVGVSATMAVVVLLSGAYYFRHVEGTFADVV
jgi:lipopolysaccharide transport system permease protein